MTHLTRWRHDYQAWEASTQPRLLRRILALTLTILSPIA